MPEIQWKYKCCAVCSRSAAGTFMCLRSSLYLMGKRPRASRCLSREAWIVLSMVSSSGEMWSSVGEVGAVWSAASMRALRRAARALVSWRALRTFPCGLMTISGGSIWREYGAGAVGVWWSCVEVTGKPGAGSAGVRASISLSVRGVLVINLKSFIVKTRHRQILKWYYFGFTASSARIV